MIAKISTAHLVETEARWNVLNKISSGRAEFPLPARPFLFLAATEAPGNVLNRIIHTCGKLGGKV
jgi:hypothetical protein